MQRFSSKKKQRNEKYQQMLARRYTSRNIEKKDRNSTNIQDSTIEQLQKPSFNVGGERWLITKRFRSEYLENSFDNQTEKEKILKNLKRTLTLLQVFHLTGIQEGELQLIKKYGQILYEQALNTLKIDTFLWKKVNHFYQQLDKIAKVIAESQQQEMLMEILNCEIWDMS